MKLILTRKYFKPAYTIGTLDCVGADGNAVRLCDTLEPPASHATSRMGLKGIRRLKEAGFRAVPRGEYSLKLTMSARFGKVLPLVGGVPGFKGVRIHAGNYPRDTRGCILPGWNRRKGMVCGSRSAMAKIMGLLRASPDNCIEIREAPG